MNSMEECNYDYCAPCYYMLSEEPIDHRAGILSISNTSMALQDIEIQGSEQDGRSYKQNISYLSDIPIPEYFKDKEFPFLKVKIQDIPHPIQLLPSDFYHLQLTLKKSRLTPQVFIINSKLSKNKVRFTTKIKTTFRNSYILSEASFHGRTSTI